MPVLLHLDASMDPAGSRSRAVSAALAEAWRSVSADHTVVRRDLHADPLPYLSDPALHWPPRLRPPGATPPADQERVQQEVLDELLAADAVVIGAPMYNYSLPATLKTWVDYIHVPGVTTPFDVDSQPLAGRPAVVISSRGGIYDPGTPTAGWDHEVPALQVVLGEALGMAVTVLTVSRTLAGFAPALADQIDTAQTEFDAAVQRAGELGRELGRELEGAAPSA
ncbi:FMN-dependent NADH-azoreductase [Nakamurella leprariae]|uniref:FMN dependent NADH:quinone oxidoreductase n=1 Tax=Nakamurella leprariae TaxID=2803911 RepID=A0A939BX31_9ACTN|nr:NAD(P)H-dependent oxidoreductase [Nakamurella leprariae]MBM9468143.1 NAD(P)H-dependent oxidoreductase [Nakamurella leprariae]